MTRRGDKQVERSFMVGDKPKAEVWAVCDYCSPECDAEGAAVVELFTNEQTARQFAEARNYPSARKMHVYSAMKAMR